MDSYPNAFIDLKQRACARLVVEKYYEDDYESPESF